MAAIEEDKLTLLRLIDTQPPALTAYDTSWRVELQQRARELQLHKASHDRACFVVVNLLQ
jgi:hypothetical protein